MHSRSLLLLCTLLALGFAAPPSRAQAPAPQATADLPTVEVGPRPVHVVPDHDAPPPPPVTIKHRARESIAHAAAERPARRPAPRRRSPPLPTTIISGRARLGAQLSLTLRGRAVPLFGVRLPPEGDHCAASGGATRPCGAAARALLAARLSDNAAVSCRVPPGQRDHGSAAICLDASGVDLGGMLVGEGLALADRTTSFDYVGAEGVAHSLHRGLWRYR